MQSVIKVVAVSLSSGDFPEHISNPEQLRPQQSFEFTQFSVTTAQASR